MKTVNVKCWGQMCAAYYDARLGLLWVYDKHDGYFTLSHNLTSAQIRYVKGRTKNA